MDLTLARIESLLDDTRRAILAGELAALPALGADLAAAIETLPPTDAASAQAIRAKAERNLACLDAASHGVRAARRRLAEIRQATAGTVVVYDDQGRRSETQPERPARHRL